MDFLNLTTFYTHQFGFRNLHSTNHGLIAITEKIRKAIDNGEITCRVFLDPQKAFDTVNHEILLSKLEYYGIRGVPLKWFKTFLTQQHQYVSIKNSISETLFNNHRVPRGSVLGPKYLGMIMHEYLTFKNHMDTVKLKLNRANGLLAKLRYYASPKLLRTIYYAIFEHHLRYGCQLWGQAQPDVLQNIEKIQNKALKILNFKNPSEPID